MEEVVDKLSESVALLGNDLKKLYRLVPRMDEVSG